MKTYALTHLADRILLQDLATLVARDRTHTAELIAHLAEVDRRKLYRPAAHPSMFSYCMSVLHLSEQATYKRLRVARMARRFPVIYDVLAEGRVHLSGLVLLKPFLTRSTVHELLAAATHKSYREIKKLLADRYPKEDVATRVRALPVGRAVAAAPAADPNTDDQLFARTVADPLAEGEQVSSVPRAEEPGPVMPHAKPAKVEPLAPRRYALQLTISQEMHDKLRHAQALLSHALPSGDVAAVLERALDELIAKLEKAKFAATEKPRGVKQVPARILGMSRRT